MKCKHNKCVRQAEENGFCSECIQLNTKFCNFCLLKEGTNHDWKHCSICGKKIGFFRRVMGDRSCFGFIPSNQFCSNDCYEAGLKAVLGDMEKRKKRKKKK